MSIIKSEDSKKWISALVVIGAAILGYVVYKFVLQLGIWFDLEAKVASYNVIAQGLGLLTAAGSFAYILTSKNTSSYLKEVYSELLKVVWPGKDQTVKMTIGITIALAIVAAIFTVVDWVFRHLLELFY